LGGKNFGQTRFTQVISPSVTFNRPFSTSDDGRKTQVGIERKGQGRLYYSTRLSYVQNDENAKEILAGIQVSRWYSVWRKKRWEPLPNTSEVTRGELVQVRLVVSAASARPYVVVSDAIPGGFEPVNRELATTSQIDDKAFGADPVQGGYDFEHEFKEFYHHDIRHDFARYYSDFYSGRQVVLTYIMQAIAPGTFSAEPAHAEELYDPDVYGNSLPAKFTVKE
jgi:uncharacterized protein YfaS (alpha-2-macroglobulin family)